MQTPQHLSPRSIGDVLDAAFRLFRARFLTLLGIAALLQVPAAVVQFVAQLPFTNLLVDLTNFTPAPGQNPLEAVPWAEIAFFYALLMGLGLVQVFLVNNLVGGAVVSAAIAHEQGRAVGLLGSYREGARSLGTLLLATLLLALVSGLLVALLFGCVIGVAAGLASTLSGENAALQAGLVGGGLGLLALLVLIPVSLFFSTRFSLLIPAVVVERLGPIAGLRRSWHLTGPGFWRALLILFLIGILTYLVTSLPAQFASFVVTLGMGGRLEAFTTSTAVATLFTYLGLILVQPLQILVQLFLYYDLRVRYEAYDLELRAQNLAAGSQ
jgi:hypothetical protein